MEALSSTGLLRLVFFGGRLILLHFLVSHSTAFASFTDNFCDKRAERIGYSSSDIKNWLRLLHVHGKVAKVILDMDENMEWKVSCLEELLEGASAGCWRLPEG